MDKNEEKLKEFRSYIDEVDELLAKLLIVRTQVVEQVGALKAKSSPGKCHIRPAREGQMHRKLAERFKDTEVPPRMALAIWRQLIGGSTHLESPLNVSYLRAYPEHRYLAREYFGTQIGSRDAAGLTEALADLRAGESNLLILPHPESHSWWMESTVLHAMGLRIFAYIPVETHLLPKEATAAVALAPVKLEDSGDDISYFINQNTGGLEIVDGFVAEKPNHIFLGAHPKPLNLRS